MNKDDNIELLDTSGKVDSTTTLNSQKTSTSSDMQGNQILSGLDSPSVPVPRARIAATKARKGRSYAFCVAAP